MINGSPRANGNTSIALNEMKTVFEKRSRRGDRCRSAVGAVKRGMYCLCRCAELGKCVFDDVVNKLAGEAFGG